MGIRYAHTNIISENWAQLARFYQDVFDCTLVPPQRDQSGQWLEEGTGVKDARLSGVHLRLPGHGEDDPTLEIYSYSQMENKPPPLANRKGIGHLAFSVDDVAETLKNIMNRGGKALGKVTTREVPQVGQLTFVYATDPEGNIIEIQKWN